MIYPFIQVGCQTYMKNSEYTELHEVLQLEDKTKGTVD